MIQAHLDVAARYSQLSRARRLKVGAVVVKDDRIISIGYNGTPPGWDNNCEYEVPLPQQEISPGIVDAVYRCELKTKAEVLHAEENAIGKLARSHESGAGAAMFITHAPCAQCAKLILVSGIKSVFYRDTYRDDSGVKFLEKGGVEVQQIKEELWQKNTTNVTAATQPLT
jgi:dCMP deaminase